MAFLAFFSGVSAAECTPETAANYYADKSYHEAMACYEELLRTGESPELYYNYANSCYKSGHLGLAILNYEKALKINPFYDDAKFNLALVNQQITDKIDPLETFFLVPKRVFKAFVGYVSGSIFSKKKRAVLILPV